MPKSRREQIGEQFKAGIDRDFREMEIDKRTEGLPEPDLTDPDNPEWTEADFARATPAEQLPDEILQHFPKTRARVGGRPKSANPKEQVTLRLAPDILEHFKAGGPGWQTRMEAVLRNAVKAAGGHR